MRAKAIQWQLPMSVRVKLQSRHLRLSVAGDHSHANDADRMRVGDPRLAIERSVIEWLENQTLELPIRRWPVGDFELNLAGMFRPRLLLKWYSCEASVALGQNLVIDRLLTS